FVRERALADEAQRRLLELRERHRADVAARAFAHGDLALFHLAVAADEHERNLLQLRVAYLRADLVAARVQLHSKARLPKLARDAFGVLVHAVSYRQHRDMHRREPKGKRARVVFDEHAEEAFDRAEERAVNHDGPVRLVILADVFEVEAFREVEVELHGRQLPRPTDCVFDAYVNLRPVEDGLALHALERNGALAQSADEGPFGALPVFVRAEVLLGGVAAAHREFDFELLEPEGLVNV